eukprot:625134-Pyramimonas_sp.AAC.1
MACTSDTMACCAMLALRPSRAFSRRSRRSESSRRVRRGEAGGAKHLEPGCQGGNSCWRRECDGRFFVGRIHVLRVLPNDHAQRSLAGCGPAERGGQGHFQC